MEAMSDGLSCSVPASGSRSLYLATRCDSLNCPEGTYVQALLRGIGIAVPCSQGTGRSLEVAVSTLTDETHSSMLVG